MDNPGHLAFLKTNEFVAFLLTIFSKIEADQEALVTFKNSNAMKFFFNKLDNYLLEFHGFLHFNKEVMIRFTGMMADKFTHLTKQNILSLGKVNPALLWTLLEPVHINNLRSTEIKEIVKHFSRDEKKYFLQLLELKSPQKYHGYKVYQKITNSSSQFLAAINSILSKDSSSSNEASNDSLKSKKISLELFDNFNLKESIILIEDLLSVLSIFHLSVVIGLMYAKWGIERQLRLPVDDN